MRTSGVHHELGDEHDLAAVVLRVLDRPEDVGAPTLPGEERITGGLPGE